jgi:hypothetical protein
VAFCQRTRIVGGSGGLERLARQGPGALELCLAVSRKAACGQEASAFRNVDLPLLRQRGLKVAARSASVTTP